MSTLETEGGLEDEVHACIYAYAYAEGGLEDEVHAYTGMHMPRVALRTRCAAKARTAHALSYVHAFTSLMDPRTVW